MVYMFLSSFLLSFFILYDPFPIVDYMFTDFILKPILIIVNYGKQN